MNTATAHRQPLDFSTLVMPLRPSLRHRALRLTRDPEAADDLVQDTLTRAWRGWSGFVPGSDPRTSARAWAHTILRNAFCSRHRRDTRALEASQRLANEARDRTAVAVAYSEAAPVRPDQAVTALEIVARIEAAIADLPDDYREAVTLADVEGLSYKAIAEIMECPIGTVMSRIHRGRRLLRAALHADAADAGIVQA